MELAADSISVKVSEAIMHMQENSVSISTKVRTAERYCARFFLGNIQINTLCSFTALSSTFKSNIFSHDIFSYVAIRQQAAEGRKKTSVRLGLARGIIKTWQTSMAGANPPERRPHLTSNTNCFQFHKGELTGAGCSLSYSPPHFGFFFPPPFLANFLILEINALRYEINDLNVVCVLI